MRILIAEDDPVSRRLLQAMLEKWGYDVVVTCDGSQAWRSLQGADSPQLAIVDWMMPGMTGLDVCREARQASQQDHYNYLILLTARGQKQDIVEGMEAGADDYITKPFDCDELKARLRAAKRILDLQEQLVNAREALREQATHDALTGIWNRGAILEILQRELVRSYRQQTPVGLIIADIDFFKQVNDTCGHKCGDIVLTHTAKTMQSYLRPYDSLGRYGGEEFLIVLPGCNTLDAAQKAEILRQGVAETHIQTSRPVTLTISLGVVSSQDFPHVDSEGLIHAADGALYCAKRSGRNRVEIATGLPAPLGL